MQTETQAPTTSQQIAPATAEPVNSVENVQASKPQVNNDYVQRFARLTAKERELRNFSKQSP